MKLHTSNAAARLARGVSLSTLAATMVIGTAAFAQTAPVVTASADAAESGDAIVVTGFRASLDSSAKIKRNMTIIVDSVSAEDIGKLPDVSIADSLARLPGVTAQRLEGRDQRLSIRGLGPDFGTTLLNGREQVTVGDNRGVEYDQYPSEFFKNVNVYKSADASIVAAGISGTVDLRMLRPLASKDRVIALQARGQINGQKSLNPDSSRFGYRGSATYIDQFADHTWGIAIGLSATSAPSQDERYNAWGYPTDGGNLILGGAKPYVQSNVLNRYGAVGTIEYQPNDNWHSTLDLLYSHFQETQHLRGIEFPLVWGGSPHKDSTITDGFVTKTTFTDVVAVQRNDYNQRKADNFSAGWNNVIAIGDKMHLNVDASWSHAKRTDFLLETYTGTGYQGSGAKDTVTITQQPNGTFKIVPTLNYADTSIFKITDPRGWGYNGTTPVVQAGFLNKPSFKDDLKSIRADLDGEFGDGFLHGWQVGANFTRREKTSNFLSYFLCPNGGNANCTVRADGVGTSAPVPSAAILKDTVSLDYLGVPQMLTLDPLYLYNNSLTAVYDNRPVSLVRDNTVTENIFTGYAMLKFDGIVAELPLRGNIGVQAIHSNQSSDGSYSSFNSKTGVVTVVPTSARDNYWNFLPSVNFALELAPATYMKMGASRTMVRARLDQLRVNTEYKINFGNLTSPDPNNSIFSSEAGNTYLRPYKSDNLDISFEKYFEGSGYVAIAGYYKHLSDFVNPKFGTLQDFSQLLVLIDPALRPQVGTTLGAAYAPNNLGSGYLTGFEATLSLPFSKISDSLSGFGFFGSGSYTFSNIKFRGNPQAITLPGLSDWVATAELFYEKNGFQVRGSYRYRSSFLGEVAGLSANPTYRQVKPEGILDAQIGYEFQPGSSLAGLSVLFQAKNLTDRPFITYQNNDPRQVIDYQRYGRDFYVGVGYKF